MPSGPAPPTLRKYFFFSGSSSGVAKPSAISFTVPLTSFSAALGMSQGKAVYDFVERAVAAAGDDELAAFVGGALRDFGGMPRAGGFREIGFDAAAGKYPSRFVEQAPSAAAAVASVRIVNQKSVSRSESHRWFKGPVRIVRDSFYIMSGAFQQTLLPRVSWLKLHPPPSRRRSKISARSCATTSICITCWTSRKSRMRRMTG